MELILKVEPNPKYFIKFILGSIKWLVMVWLKKPRHVILLSCVCPINTDQIIRLNRISLFFVSFLFFSFLFHTFFVVCRTPPIMNTLRLRYSTPPLPALGSRSRTPRISNLVTSAVDLIFFVGLCLTRISPDLVSCPLFLCLGVDAKSSSSRKHRHECEWNLSFPLSILSYLVFLERTVVLLRLFVEFEYVSFV